MGGRQESLVSQEYPLTGIPTGLLTRETTGGLTGGLMGDALHRGFEVVAFKAQAARS